MAVFCEDPFMRNPRNAEVDCASGNSDVYATVLSAIIKDVEKKIANKEEVIHCFGSRGDPLPTTFKLTLSFGKIRDGWLSVIVKSSRHASIIKEDRVLRSGRGRTSEDCIIEECIIEECFIEPSFRPEGTNAEDSPDEDPQDEDSPDEEAWIRNVRRNLFGSKNSDTKFHKFCPSSKGTWRFTTSISYKHTSPAASLSIEEGRHTRQQGDLLSLFESSKDADITFCFDNGHKIPAHKLILSARAPYFANMFDSGMKEASSNEIRVRDVDPNVFKSVLRHLYSGAAPINLAEIALEVHAAADKYGLDELKEICESCVCDNLSADNVVDVFVFAEERSCVKIRDRALVVLRENMDTLNEESASKLKDNPELLFQLSVELSKM